MKPYYFDHFLAIYYDNKSIELEKEKSELDPGEGAG